jgi:hypothetical protein
MREKQSIDAKKSFGRQKVSGGRILEHGFG